MKIFTCTNCQNLLYFENSQCLKCGCTVGFDETRVDMVSLIGDPTNGYTETGGNNFRNYRFCRNAAFGTCNWLLAEGHNNEFCIGCNLNRTIPALISDENQALWKRIEIAKHRLIYSLLRLRLPIERKMEGSDIGIVFDFLGDDYTGNPVMTGHDNGVITLNIAEADEIKRVSNKVELGERYRTLLGHFRHEIGHYYWDVLMQYDQDDLLSFRNIFGDETKDYPEALKYYYENGTSANWIESFISPYATSHPWEDWAETWAHYLHIMDTLETAMNFGIGIDPKKNINVETSLEVETNKDPYSIRDFQKIIDMWLPLTFALNSLNRSMGQSDFYPFFVSQPLIEKLKFIHALCGRRRFNS